MTEREEFSDWFYREYCSTPERRRQYSGTGIQELLRKAYEAGVKAVEIWQSDKTEGAK